MSHASSVIRSIDYNVDTEDLTVELQSGASYCYHNVPSEVHDDFVEAESLGKFFNTNIRGKFKFWPNLSISKGENPMKITIDREFLRELQTVLAVHLATLRMQKQGIVSELEFVSGNLVSAEKLGDNITKMLSTSAGLQASAVPEAKKSATEPPRS